MTIKDFLSAVSDGKIDRILKQIYGGTDNEILKQRVRLIDACEHFSKKYPECDEIRIFSNPLKTTWNEVSFFLATDRIIIRGENGEEYVSEDIPEKFSAFEESEGYKDYFSGYSLCYAWVEKLVRKPKSVDFKEFLAVLEDDEKERGQLESEAIKNGNIAEFFKIVNGSLAHTICDYKIQKGVIIGRKFLGGDGAVMAQKNMMISFVPTYLSEEYAEIMGDIFGSDFTVTGIRSTGGIEITI